VFGTVLFVTDNQRRFPGRKADKIAVWHFEYPSGSRFNLERLVLGDQLFHQRSVHLIQVTGATIRAEARLSKQPHFIRYQQNKKRVASFL